MTHFSQKLDRIIPSLRIAAIKAIKNAKAGPKENQAQKNPAKSGAFSINYPLLGIT
jgi:hypothetical protein